MGTPIPRSFLTQIGEELKKKQDDAVGSTELFTFWAWLFVFGVTGEREAATIVRRPGPIPRPRVEQDSDSYSFRLWPEVPSGVHAH